MGFRIAFYMPDLSGGGVERMRLSLIAALRARDFAVSLVVGQKRGSLLDMVPADLPLVELQSTNTWGASLALARFLRDARPDVLIASLDHNNISALLAGQFAGASTKIIICQHNALSAEGVLGWRYRAVPWAYWLLQHYASGIVAVSAGVADDLAVHAGIPRARITVIGNPVIDADFHQRKSAPVAHPWLIDKTMPVVVFAGRLRAQKDAENLLLAFHIVRKTRAAKLIIMGEGPLLKPLQELAARLALLDDVHFAGFQANPLPWIAAADVLACPSRYEGLGNVIIEALGCGTKVVATDCPHGPAEILAGGAFGHLVPPGDPSALAAAMCASLDTPVARELLTARAACFSAGACADAHIQLFDQIMQRRVTALGLALSPLSTGQVVDAVLRRAGALRLIVTPNIDHVRLLRRADFSAAYHWAAMQCPDGFPVFLYGWLRGLRLGRRVTGCDIFHCLVRHPGLAEKRLFIVAESDETACKGRAWATARGLGANIVIAVAPLRFAHDKNGQIALCAAIAAAKPDILVLTLGAPLSEMFVYQNREALPPCWALCLGQAFRVELGLVRRAPHFLQLLGLEWCWRLWSEPKRLAGRYLRAMAWFPVAILRDLTQRPRKTPS